MRSLLCALLAVTMACAPPRTTTPVTPVAPAHASLVFHEVFRVAPMSKVSAPKVSLCEASGGLFVCGSRALLRAEGDAVTRATALEVGLPHEADGTLGGEVTELVGHFPDAAWLRLTTGGPCENVYRFRGDRFVQEGQPHCRSIALTTTLVVLGSRVAFVSAAAEGPVEIHDVLGNIVGTGVSDDDGGQVVVGTGSWGLAVAHRAGSGMRLDVWSPPLGTAREVVIPDGVSVHGFVGDVMYGGSGDDGNERHPWAARFDGVRLIPIAVPGLTRAIDTWRRDSAGVEWVLSDGKIHRRADGSAFVIAAPSNAFDLWSPQADAVWIAAAEDDGSRRLLRAERARP